MPVGGYHFLIYLEGVKQLEEEFWWNVRVKSQIKYVKAQEEIKAQRVVELKWRQCIHLSWVQVHVLG